MKNEDLYDKLFKRFDSRAAEMFEEKYDNDACQRNRAGLVRLYYEVKELSTLAEKQDEEEFCKEMMKKILFVLEKL